jgi:5-guanidino-2-oxopentanoate decarboxylase
MSSINRSQDPFKAPLLNPHVNNAGWSVLSTLKNYGVETVFGIPGTHNLEFYRHLPALGIRAITTRHEQGAGYSADGFAQVGAGVGVVITTSGPGLLNALSAMGNAYCESRPMIVLSPGVSQGLENSNIGILHETKSTIGASDSVAAWSKRVSSASEAVQAIHDAFEMFRYGRPRPVHIEIPLDVLEKESNATPEEMEARPVREHQGPSVQEIKDVAEALAASKKPAIVAGGGAVSASRELTQIAEMLQAPVLTSLNGKGVVDESHPLSLGSELRIARSLEVLNQADLVLMVGTKVGEAELWGNKFEPIGKVVRIDRIPSQLEVNWVPDVKLVGDSKQVLRELVTALSDYPKRESVDLSKVRQEIAEAVREVSPQLVEISELICSSIPSNSIVTGDSSQITYFGMASVFKASRPSQFLYTPTYATLGYGLSAAIGAKIAEPRANVISVLGDGALMFSIQEFATAVEQGLDLTVVLIDNGGYGEIKNNEAAIGINPIGVDLFQPDWVALIESFGGLGHRVSDKTQLPELVSKAIAESGISLVHVPIELFD